MVEEEAQPASIGCPLTSTGARWFTGETAHAHIKVRKGNTNKGSKLCLISIIPENMDVTFEKSDLL